MDDGAATDEPARVDRTRGFFALVALGVLGILALVFGTEAGTYDETAAELGVSVEALLLGAAVQSTVLLAVAVAVGLVLAPRMGFRSHVLARVSRGARARTPSRTEVRQALGLGAVVGGLLLVAQAVAQRRRSSSRR